MTEDQVNEATVGRAEARAALAESRSASDAADMMIAESRALIQQVRASRERNHFADKMRTIIQGRR